MRADVIGREAEIAAAAAVIEGLADGPAAILLEGEAGIGKTTIWREVVGVARRRHMTVLATRPAQSDSGLAFGALADLLRDVEDEVVARLPAPQRRALEAAILRADPGEGDADPRAVPVAMVSLLREIARHAPLLIALDDAQWLDSASAAALGYAIRRLGNAPACVLAAVLTPGPGSALALETAVPADRLRRLRVGPIGVAALHDVFEARLGHSFSRPMLVRIAEASAGNAFDALEMARALDDAATADGGEPGLARPLPVPTAIRDLARERVRHLPATTRAALLRVAALGRPTTRLVPVGDLAPAEAAGMVEVRLDGRVAFAHPLFAAAVYGDAPATERRAVHRELAAVVDDLEERARHEALAATGADPRVAELLTSAGARARARGAPAMAAELIQLALWLTPPDDPSARFDRELLLAQYLSLAGQPAHAAHVLGAAIEGAPAGAARDEALITLGLVCRETDLARAIEACEAALAGSAEPAVTARAHATLGLLLETVDVGRASEHAAAAAERYRALGDRAGWSFSALNHAWLALLRGEGADDAAFDRALEAQAEAGASGRWRSAVPPSWALAHDDFGTARRWFGSALERARNEGHETDVALLTGIVAHVDLWRGRPVEADDGSALALDLARVCGSPATLADALRIRANVDAMAGRLDAAREALGPGLAALERPDAGRFGYATSSILGFVAWTEGDAATADAELTRATEVLEALGVRETPGHRYLGDHVEAVLALGDTERADRLVAGLEARAAVFPRPWSLAVAARGRGLVLAATGDLDGAMAAVDAAVLHHDRLESPYELGRTLLAKAHVHRRRTEKRLARDTLEQAVDLLDAAGAVAWAERARRELARIRFRTAPTELTETELLIAELAAVGHTNREIAGTVYVSPKTVETRLASVYGKLGIRSRAELGAWMAARDGVGAAPGR